ncbi:MAG: Fic family protein [Treponema sp.]|nr:Fic family protein [Treponema sp.]
MIPADAAKPERSIRHSLKAVKKETLLERLQREKSSTMKGSLYHKIQIDLTYNSNHIEGSRLTHEQTRYIFETKTVGMENNVINVDDIVETVNHFRCVELVIDAANRKLSESFIKQLHFILKTGTSDAQKAWFKVGGYKMLENEVGGMDTAKPSEVSAKMKTLLADYNALKQARFDDVLDFHVRFEKIHPFQDGNGRIGRLLLFKECLKHNIVPFIITEELKLFYYRGIKEWQNERGFLRDTCRAAQDEFTAMLENSCLPYSAK